MSTADDLRRGARRKRPNTIDQESKADQTLHNHKGSLAAYRGHLTRLYREMEAMSMDSPVAIQTKRSALERVFRNYEETSFMCLQSLAPSMEREVITLNYREEYERYEKFNEKCCRRRHDRETVSEARVQRQQAGHRNCTSLNEFSEVAKESRRGAASVDHLNMESTTPRDVNPMPFAKPSSRNSRHERDSNLSDDASRKATNQGQQRSVCSSNSSQVSKAQVELAMAQLRFKHLEESKALEAEIKRLESKSELLNARSEIDRAKLLVKFETDEGDERSSILEGIPKQSSLETVNKYLQSFHEPEPQRDIDNKSSIWPRPPLTKTIKEDRGDYFPNSMFHQPIDRFLERQQETLEQQQQTMNLLSAGLERLQMPQREFLSFDGNPTKYHRFIRNFESNVEDRIQDCNIRLSYLIQYCTGVAKEAIENCVILSPETGYREAREILRKNFGQKHNIVRAFINKVIDGPQLKASETEKLLQLARDMRNCELNSIQMGYKSDINSMETLKRVVRRLPLHLQSRWAEESGKLIEAGGDPEFANLTGFVEKRAALANTEFGKLIGSKPDEDRDQRFKFKRKPERKFEGGTHVTTLAMQTQKLEETEQKKRFPSATKCAFCECNHDLTRCYKFRNKAYKERREFTRSKKLCDNCLRGGHHAFKCNYTASCLFSECGKRHHSLLHPPFKEEPPSIKDQGIQRPGITDQGFPRPGIMDQGSHLPSIRDQVSDANDKQIFLNCGATKTEKARVSLRVVPVRISGEDGREIETYAFLDNGSDSTLCLSSLVEELGLSGNPTEFTLTTVNAERNTRSGLEVKMKVKALKSDGEVQLDRVLTVDRLPITSTIPSTEELRGLSYLRDIEFPRLEDGKVSILIGSDAPDAHWIFEERRGKRKEPYAVRTPLGWTLIGPIGGRDDSVNVNFITEDQELISKQLERMYNNEFSESLSHSKESMSIEDTRALTIMKSTVSLIDGHYQLSLPWRCKSPCLPNNRSVAERRLQFLERRLLRDDTLLKSYKKAIEEYVELGHARRIPENYVSTQGKVWYLPHHPVFHPQKPGKTRVVFDCAAKFQGTSLNDQLLQGPDMTSSLMGVLLRFRLEQVAFIADIEKMFLQVRVTPKDCDLLRFLWWPDGELLKKPVDYQMLVHIFGASSSPSCASFALRRTAEDNRSDFDVQTVDTVFRNFYVDDCLKSVPTKKEAIKQTNQLSKLLNKGGFRLTKFISNHREVMLNIPEEDRAKSVKNLDLERLPVDRALGMIWDVEDDMISFRTATQRNVDTRRKILSLVSSVYDPLGFAAPLILPAKKLLQELHKKGYGWDDVIPKEHLGYWQEWINHLPRLNDIKVPRCIKPSTFAEIRSIQLHNFSDASEVGYGAASYLRLEDTQGAVNATLLLGKSRVAPLKTVTIPRLELSAATVATKLSKKIQEEIDIPIHQVIFWTDSTIVLQYIRNRTRRFQTFVANRLAIIHDNSAPDQWRHVNSTSNPADDASRGIKANETTKIIRWLQGPEFLPQGEHLWPQQPEQLKDLPEDDKEIKIVKIQSYAVSQDKPLDSLLHRYSSWFSLLKAVSWLLRFAQYIKYRVGRIPASKLKKGHLEVSEIVVASRTIVRLVQSLHFPKELELLKKQQATQDKTNLDNLGVLKKQLHSTSPIRKLSPVLIDDIIRVGGRLQRAPIDYCARHQIILPSVHHVTKLIIEHYHKALGHIGTNQVLASIRQKFWILQGPTAVKRVIRKCLNCQRWNVRPGEQLMAPLPTARVTPGNPPFTSVGVDYFGPIYVKVKRSNVKRYGCVFTCLAVRAIHIEVAHDLSTDSFIQAFTRFVSRRGPPLEVFSDNGTNFKGAEADVKHALERWNQHRIADHCLKEGIVWHFNAPAASHAGGIWERMIRSIRRILRSLLGMQLVNDETLLTLLAEVEKIINDRPITPQTDDANDLEPLTPNMLLLARPNPCYPPGDFTPDDLYNQRWRQCQYLANIFWKRWTKEYLPMLQERQKWLIPRRNLKVGDLVLVLEGSMPRGHWKLGIIEDTRYDRFGYVRTATVRTATSRLLRDVRKLCLLEGELLPEKQ